MSLGITFLVFDGITQLDFTAPAQAFSRLPGATITTVAKTAAPIATDSGFSILPSATFADAPKTDLLCVPGGGGVATAAADAETIAFVQRAASEAGTVTSVCTGAFILGAAGLLKGRRATTHWAYTGLLPLVGATHEPARVVEDGNIITGGGVTAGLDFALQVIARIAGKEVAEDIQLFIEYDPAPPFPGGSPETAPASVRDRVEPAFEARRAGIRSALEGARAA